MPALQSLFFDGPVGPLYGCLHAARRSLGSRAEVGVVLAGAHGHEAIRFHRVLQQLARMLAAAGLPVLRFDGSGCGDSVGGPELWSLETWERDLAAALAELRRRTGVERVGVVGLRLGGTLACRAADRAGAGDGAPSFLVLWDPVVNGSAYLGELRDVHREMLSTAHVLPARDAAAGEELLGFPMPPSLAEELEALRLGAPPRAPLPPVRLVESNPKHPLAALRDELAPAGEVRWRSFSNPHLWSWDENWARIHVPIEILQHVAAEALELALGSPGSRQ